MAPGRSVEIPCPKNVDLDKRGPEVVREPTLIFLVILIKYLEAPFNLFDQTPTEVRENKLCFCAALIADFIGK